MGRTLSAKLTATIAGGATTSDKIDVTGLGRLAVYMPDLTTSANVAVHGSIDDANWEALYNPELATPGAVICLKQKVTIIKVAGLTSIKFVAADAQTGDHLIYCKGL
jgi:hypothetical protein